MFWIPCITHKYWELNYYPCFPAKAKEKPIQVVYVPSHLFHMLFELFKVRQTISEKRHFYVLSNHENTKFHYITYNYFFVYYIVCYVDLN